jgi:hypothetical protein
MAASMEMLANRMTALEKPWRRRLLVVMITKPMTDTSSPLRQPQKVHHRLKSCCIDVNSVWSHSGGISNCCSISGYKDGTAHVLDRLTATLNYWQARFTTWRINKDCLQAHLPQIPTTLLLPV